MFRTKSTQTLSEAPLATVERPLTKKEQRKIRHRTVSAKSKRIATAGAGELRSIPEIVDQERRDACERDLLLFLVTYFPHSAGLSPFSDDHIKFIKRLEASVLHGGRELDAVYRGFAKTTIGQLTGLWAVIYGHIQNALILGFDAVAAGEHLDSIKTEITTNEMLAEDFPEVCYPFKAIDGRPQGAGSQTYLGERTRLSFTAEKLIFPVIPGSKCSGSCIQTKGLLKARRGMVHKRYDGANIRLQWVFIDDPQDEESAASPAQCTKRINKLYKTVLYSGSHQGKRCAVFIAATVIEAMDFVDQLMDRELHPSFSSHKVPMVRSWSDNPTHWEEYCKILVGFDKDDPDDRVRARRDALAYYEEHREDMDAGCDVSWDECYSREEEMYEVSGIQHAYNLLFENGEDVFACECQQDPTKGKADLDCIGAKEMARKCSGFKQGVIPTDCTHLTMFIDVQGKALYWAMTAWTQDLKGYIIDYGTWPEQPGRRFTLKTLRRTFGRVFKGADRSGAIFNALEILVEEKVAARYKKVDGSDMRVAICLVDANWGEETKTVKDWFLQTKHAASVLPSHGRAIDADNLPIMKWVAKPGDVKGENWIIHKPYKRDTKCVTFDANYFKTRTMEGLTTPRESRGAITLYEANPSHHEQIGDHVAIELPELKKGKRRKIFQWVVPPNLKNQDNHWWDCLVGCRVCASLCGITSETPPPLKPRKRGKVIQ